MDELLKPITTVSIRQQVVQPGVASLSTKREVKTIDDALVILQDQPSEDELSVALSSLGRYADKSQDAMVFQAANVVVTQIIPSWWDHISSNRGLKDIKVSLIDYLCRITCLGVLIARLKSLVSAFKTSPPSNDNPSGREIGILLDVLSNILSTDGVIHKVYERIMLAPTSPRRDAGWKEAVSLLSSGRIISIVAEAEDFLKPQPKVFGSSWLGQGSKYSRWLGKNIGSMLPTSENSSQYATPHAAIASLLGKSLMIGFKGAQQSALSRL
jgi:telomere length regulation protein